MDQQYSFLEEKIDNSNFLSEDSVKLEVPPYLFQYLGSNQSLEKICRICLTYYECMMSLFNIREDKNCLGDLLNSFISIKIVPESGMPNQICSKCYLELVQSYNFKVKCEKAESALQSILKESFGTTNKSDEFTGKLEEDIKEEDITVNYQESELREEHNIADIQYLEDFDEIESDTEALCIVQDLGQVNKNVEKIQDLTESNLFLQEILNVSKSSKQIQKPRTVYTCNICFEKFKKIKHYKVHIKQKHSSDQVSDPCKECSEVFSSEHDLQLHSSIHMAGPTWKCMECSKEFKIRSMLKRHLVRHMDSKQYKCQTCEKSFTEFYALRRHYRVHTGEITEKKHACTICDKKYSENSLLVAHMARHSSERPFVCATCGKAFGTARLLASHRRVHSDYKQYACNYCDKRFRHDSTRNTHQRTHTGEKPYVCSVCAKTFIQNSNFRLHMRTHTGEKPYQCDKCEKMFTSGSSLKVHKRTHTGEKPYSCKICGKRFARQDLSAHSRLHSGERPFACSACPKRFVSAARLRDHCRIHTGEKPFECATCAQTFSTKAHLIKHIKKHQQKKKKQEKRRFFVVPHLEPVQYIIQIQKPEATGQNSEEDIKKESVIEVTPCMPIEVAEKLVLQETGEVLVEDNQDQSENIYITEVNECADFNNDVNQVLCLRDPQ